MLMHDHNKVGLVDQAFATEELLTAAAVAQLQEAGSKVESAQQTTFGFLRKKHADEMKAVCSLPVFLFVTSFNTGRGRGRCWQRCHAKQPQVPGPAQGRAGASCCQEKVVFFFFPLFLLMFSLVSFDVFSCFCCCFNYTTP